MTRNYLSGSIKKALEIIESVAKSPKPLRASQVSVITNLDRATSFRILTFLTSLGYIFKDNTTNLYSIGHKIFEFGDKSDFLKSLTTLCFNYIKNLSQITHHITYLAVLEGPHIVYCDKVDPSGESAPRAFRMRLDAHSCALGKAILAHKTRDELTAALNSIGVKAEMTERGRVEEKVENSWYQRSLGVIDIPEGPIRWINILKKDGGKHSPPRWWVVLGIPDGLY